MVYRGLLRLASELHCGPNSKLIYLYLHLLQFKSYFYLSSCGDVTRKQFEKYQTNMWIQFGFESKKKIPNPVYIRETILWEMNFHLQEIEHANQKASELGTSGRSALWSRLMG